MVNYLIFNDPESLEDIDEVSSPKLLLMLMNGSMRNVTCQLTSLILSKDASKLSKRYILHKLPVCQTARLLL